MIVFFFPPFSEFSIILLPAKLIAVLGLMMDCSLCFKILASSLWNLAFPFSSVVNPNL